MCVSPNSEWGSLHYTFLIVSWLCMVSTQLTLEWLPQFFSPVGKFAQYLKAEEKELRVGHWY